MLKASGSPERSDTRAAGCSCPAHTIPAGVRLSLSSCRAASIASGPSTSASSAVSGASYAAERTCPASTRGFAWSRIAASTRRPSSLSGSRMKNWSSPSSLATSTATPLPGASPLLAERGDRAGEADADHRVEQPDVDAELESVRGRHAEQVALRESPFDLAPLRCGVPGAVRGEVRVVAEPLRGEAVHELRRLAALREGQRAETTLDECRLQLRRLGERRGA